MKSYTSLKKTSAKNNEIEFRAEIPLEAIREHEGYELEHIGRTFSLPGFRKGKVPPALIREQTDPAALFEEAAQSVVRAAIAEIADDESLDAIGTPVVTIPKLAFGKPIELTVRFALNPPVELPNYKKIGAEILARKDEVTLTEKELDDAMLEMRRIAWHDALPPHLPGEKHSEPKDEELPELTDAFVAKLGGPPTVAELREHLKRELTVNKEAKLRDDKRDEVVRTIASKAKLTLPELFVKQELDRYKEDRDEELSRMNVKFEDYLKELKKTEQELATEERATMEERIRTSLVFERIREAEDIHASEREINHEISILKRHSPNMDAQNLQRTAEARVVQEKIFALFV